MEEIKQKKRSSVNRRILTQVLLLMLVISAVIAVISYGAMKTTYMRLFNERAQDIVRLVARAIDGDAVAEYAETGVTDEYYDILLEGFDDLKAGMNGIQYLYLFRPKEDHFIYILDAYREGDDPSTINKLGDIYVYDQTDYTHLVPDIEAGRASTGMMRGNEEGYGKMISAWAPVFGSDGKVAAMVGADCLMSSLNAVVRENALKIVGALLLCMAGLLVLLVLILRQNVSQPIEKLTKMVDSYELGALTEPSLRRNDEYQMLASSFGDMTRRIDSYTAEVARSTADQERLRAEFSIAKQIQTDILPNEFPAFPDRKEIDVVASIDLSKEISGDFYDYFLIDKDHLVLAVGDVSDKGVPAAMFMVIIMTLIKSLATQGFSPAEIMQKVSDQILEGNQTNMFCTVWLAVLELSTGKGIAANAGHQHPILHRTGKRFAYQEYRHSPPVGAIEGIRFRDHGFQLEPGDMLFVYTDGIKEVVNERGEMFGADRVLEALNREPEASPSVLLQTLKESLDRFRGDAETSDTVVMMSMKYYGPNGAADVWR